MAALDNFRINDPNFQNTADELANRAYWEARDRGLDHLDALSAMEMGPMALDRNLLSVTGTKGEMHGYIGKSIRDDVLQYRPERLLPPPAQAAPALTPSHLTGTKMGSAPQPALQTDAPAEPKAALEHPKPYMHSAIANDPLLQLMAGGNKKRLGPVETYRFFKTLDPAAQQQHASRVDGSHLAKLEKREAMGGGTEYGNLDGTVTAGAGDQNESGDPVDALQEREIARLQEVERMKRINNPLGGTGGALTGTSGEFPVTKTHNRLTNLLSGLSRDAIGFAKDVKQHGITLTWNGNTIFATDGENTVPVTEETAAAINDANNGGDAQDPSQRDEIPLVPDHPPMGMSFNGQPAALTDTNTDNGTGNTVVTKDNGALTSNTASNGNAARRMTGGYTGNARGSDLPDMQIGLNERLMRMGAAGLAAGGQGSLAQMGAMFGASANVNEANRQGAMDTFKIEEERRQAHADRVATLAASKNKGAGGGDIGSVGDVRMGMAKLQTALDMFNADTDSSISGYNWKAIYSRLYGRTLGNEDEAKRLFLNELRLDSIMQRVAETKGAISNAEMQLFASQAPTMDSNDIVWTSWLKRQLKMQQIILNRLQTGQRVDESAPITTTMPDLDTGGGGSTGSGADADTLNAARKIVGG